MKIPAFALLLLFLLSSCQSADELPPAPPADKRFQTSDPSRLYFNNIRSSAYRILDYSDRYTKVYTMANWPDTAATAFLVPSIVDFWLYDQAYIDLEWRAASQPINLPWQLIVEQEKQQDTLLLNSKHWSDQYEFADKLNQILLQRTTKLSILLEDGSQLPIMSTSEVQRLFRLTWKDYSSLTDK